MLKQGWASCGQRGTGRGVSASSFSTTCWEIVRELLSFSLWVANCLLHSEGEDATAQFPASLGLTQLSAESLERMAIRSDSTQKLHWGQRQLLLAFEAAQDVGGCDQTAQHPCTKLFGAAEPSGTRQLGARVSFCAFFHHSAR